MTNISAPAAANEFSSESLSVPTPEELIERARALVPALKARASQCTAERRVPTETIREIEAAGLFKILHPKRWGGYEMEPNAFFDVQKILAEGCMSTGWVYGVVGGHPYEMALFPDQAQIDVWGEDNTVLISSSYQPVGKVERVEGGFKLSGHWGFSSGSEHCNWVLLGAMIPPAAAGEPPEMRTFLVPRSDYRIEDAWYTFGLQGTGSQDIVVEDAFVPDYRTHKSVDGFMCTNPGQAENDGPLYRLPWAQVFLRLVSTSCLGATTAALDGATEIMESRVSTNTGKASKADTALQYAIARGRSEVDEMETVLRRNMDVLYGRSVAGEEATMEERARFRFQSSSVARRCADIVDALMPLLGGRAIYMHSPLVQPWLDLNAARAHVANDPGNGAADLIATRAGQAPTFFFM